MPGKRRVVDHIVEHLAAIGIDHIFGVDGANIEDLAAMFPGLTSVDVSDLDGFAAAMRAALDVDGPAVVSVKCAADEIPSFAPFLTGTPAKTTAAPQIPTAKENRTDVAASA